MRQLLEALDGFVKEMQEKGYDSAFKTCGAYPGKLKESMLRYLEQAAMGNEKGLKEGISLSTYLKWDGPDKEFITAWLYARLPSDKFMVNMMSLKLADRYGKIKEIDIDLAGKPIPTKKEAIELVLAPKQQKLQSKRTFKL